MADLTQPVRRFWTTADPMPASITLWRGNGGVDTERTYVAMDALLSDEAIEAAGRTLDRAYERFEMTLQQVARDAVQAAVDAATGTGGAT